MSEQTKAAVDYESFASSLEPLEQKLLDSFLNVTPMCSNMRSISSTDKPDASGWEHAVRHFLGYHMIRAFDVLNFLEDTGLFVEDMEDTEEESDEVERKWTKPIYEAAPRVVQRLLSWLLEEKYYSEEDLRDSLAIAEQSIDELPCCALLSQYLPGPRHSAYEMSHSDSPFPMSSGEVASLLQSRYQDICPSVNFWGLAGAACSDKKKVAQEHSARMHVLHVEEGGGVSFTTCLQGSQPWDEPDGGISIKFDEPIAALFKTGMIVTATWQELRDDSGSRWELSTPGYVWPSWFCQDGCLQKAAAPTVEAS